MVRIKSLNCPCCGKSKEFIVSEEAVEKYQNGELIQNCFPDMNADDRERFITGICPTCWNNMFK